MMLLDKIHEAQRKRAQKGLKRKIRGMGKRSTVVTAKNRAAFNRFEAVYSIEPHKKPRKTVQLDQKAS